jgi:hypothetical protein
MGDVIVKPIELYCMTGPEKGCSVTVICEETESDIVYFCKVCTKNVYLTNASEALTNRKFCSEH